MLAKTIAGFDAAPAVFPTPELTRVTDPLSAANVNVAPGATIKANVVPVTNGVVPKSGRLTVVLDRTGIGIDVGYPKFIVLAVPF